MKVTIDRDECICCGVCWEECPEGFEENSDDELSCIVEKYRVEGKLVTMVAPVSVVPVTLP